MRIHGLEVTSELYVALSKLSLMASPTVEEILLRRGFPFEASIVAEVVAAWKEAR